jgi:hypothetical protein
MWKSPSTLVDFARRIVALACVSAFLASGLLNLRTLRAQPAGLGVPADLKDSSSRRAMPSTVSTPVTAEKPADTIKQAGFDTSRDLLKDPPPEMFAPSRIWARVNNIVILDDDIRASCWPILAHPELQNVPAEERERVGTKVCNQELQKIIDRELVIMELDSRFGEKKGPYVLKLHEEAIKEANKKIKTMRAELFKQGFIKGDTDAALGKFLTEHGTSLISYRRKLERDFISMEFIRALIFPALRSDIGHRQIVDYYQLHPTEFDTTDNVAWQNIFLDATRFSSRAEARKLADTIAAKARGATPEDFDKMVKQYDQGDSMWGQGGPKRSHRGEVRPAELEPILFGLKSKEVGAVFELPSGFQVVYVIKREYTGRKPLDEELQNEIRRKLQNEMAEHESRRVLVELRRKAIIELMPTEGK